MQNDKWYGAYHYKDSETGFEVSLYERENSWSWEVWNLGKLLGADSIYGKRAAMDAALSFIKENNEDTI